MISNVLIQYVFGMLHVVEIFVGVRIIDHSVVDT
jgi:hypothetical protein